MSFKILTNFTTYYDSIMYLTRILVCQMILALSLLYKISAQYRLTDNDSLNSYLIKKVEYLRQYGSSEQVDKFIDQLYQVKESKYENNLNIIVNILKSRSAILNNNLNELFLIFDEISKIQITNSYLNAQKNVLEGLYYLIADSVDKAIDNFFKSSLLEGVQDSDLLFLTNYYVAQILYRQENYYKSMDFFYKSVFLAFFSPSLNYDKVVLYNRIQELFSNIALCYLKTDNLPLARYYFNVCRNYIEKSRDVLLMNEDKYETDIYNQLQNFLYESLGVLKGNMGNLYIKMGYKEMGVELLKESIQINDREDFDRGDAYITAGHLINFYFENNKPDSALYYMDLYFNKIISYSLHKTISEISFNALKYFIDVNQERAKYFLKFHESSTNSYKKIKKSKSFFENYAELIDAKYKLILENERLKQEKQLQRQEFLKFLFVVVILILLFITFIYFYYSIKLRNKNLTIQTYNRELNEINKQLETANKQKSSIMSMVAHDLRGPINSMKSLNELRQDNLITSEEFNMYFNQLANDSNSVIQDILDFVKSEKRTEDKNFTIIDVKEIIYNVLTETQVIYKTKKINVRTFIDSIEIKSDPLLFKRLFNNIFSNAIKFSNENTVITINVFAEQGNLVLNVNDQGIGISEEMQKVLFEPFTKASRTGTANEPSHGLGMSIIKKIVDMHNGTIKIESQLGIGTTVEVRLPLE